MLNKTTCQPFWELPFEGRQTDPLWHQTLIVPAGGPDPGHTAEVLLGELPCPGAATANDWSRRSVEQRSRLLALIWGDPKPSRTPQGIGRGLCYCQTFILLPLPSPTFLVATWESVDPNELPAHNPQMTFPGNLPQVWAGYKGGSDLGIVRWRGGRCMWEIELLMD